MYRLHRIGGIDGRTDIAGVFEVSGQGWPFAAPGLDNHRVFVPPLGFQLLQGRFGSIQRSDFIHALEVSHKGFLMLGGDILQRVADLVDDAQLYLGVGVNAPDGLREAF